MELLLVMFLTPQSWSLITMLRAPADKKALEKNLDPEILLLSCKQNKVMEKYSPVMLVRSD